MLKLEDIKVVQIFSTVLDKLIKCKKKTRLHTINFYKFVMISKIVELGVVS